ncbi:DUF6745 domain-containing protein [Thermoactinospora rubra]|uniref:DUF6745 domain-containing protein n=1 Tax=Thermoactinospora rubra TaxID=1088767 RepID=UPI001F0B20BA|nr:hypothetical protein [Thermoactinospora rubra]
MTTTLALTPQLAARLAEAATRWEQTAVSVAPADRASAEDGVRAAYRAAGLPKPARFVWLDSPARGAIAAALLTCGPGALRAAGLDDLVADVLATLETLDAGRPVREAVRTRPWEQARARASELLGPSGWAAAWALTGRELWPGVDRLVGEIRRGIGQLATAHDSPAAEAPVTHSSPAAEATASVPADGDRAEIEALLRRVTLDAVLGQHDAAWLCLFDALGRPPEGDVLGPPLLDASSLAGLMQVSRAAGWWWPFERVVVLTERPVVHHRDELGRLHRATGPALAYPDGFALHAWHGMPVPPHFGAAMADLSPDRIRAEPNAELRRVMLEHYGFDRYLTESDATRVHQDTTGVLWRVDLADDEPLVMVEVLNSTPEPDGTRRTYFLRVPPWVTTAREGVAWTFGLRPEEYDPSRQT